ncbi:MAG: HNH endonuclease [Acidimicrobiia bacterium]|nr:HNH endonuclease [Acidimicrobiia bacterium]
MKTAALAEYARRSTEGLARRMACEELQASRRQAKREMEIAEQLTQVPKTLEALGAGEIPEAHAKQIDRAASQGPVDETVLVDAARAQDVEVFSKTLHEHQNEQSGDDGKSLLERQRDCRSVSFFKAPDDGMFILSGRFDPVAGHRIEAALAAQERRLRNDKDAADQTSFNQRLADALETLVCAEPGEQKPLGATLIITADWNAVNQRLAETRLLDGTPLPIDEAMRLACNADIIPVVFDRESLELWVGRKLRSATEAQRAALIVRDQHCIGCGRSAAWCEVHHIHEWSKGGPTDIDNLVLVCTPCHHQIHDENWQVRRGREGNVELRPPPEPDRSEPLLPDTPNRSFPPQRSRDLYLGEPTHLLALETPKTAHTA